MQFNLDQIIEKYTIKKNLTTRVCYYGRFKVRCTIYKAIMSIIHVLDYH